jgi:hypothetical protein
MVTVGGRSTAPPIQPISPSPPPFPAPRTNIIPPTDPTAWSTPTWAPGSITSLSRKVAGAGSAVQHFNWECARAGLANFPCAIQSLTGNCRGIAGGCLTCAAQAALTTGATPVPVGTLAKIKAAADASGDRGEGGVRASATAKLVTSCSWPPILVSTAWT